MKCIECDACHKRKITRYPAGNGQPSVEISYLCYGVKEPFEIKDVEQECTEYPERAAQKVKCEYCSDDYDQKIVCYSLSVSDINPIEIKFCPNCGRKLASDDTE